MEKSDALFSTRRKIESEVSNERYPVTERKGKYKHDIWFALGVDPKMTPWGALDEEIAGKRSHLPRYLLVANTLDMQLKLVKLCKVLFAIKLVGHFWHLSEEHRINILKAIVPVLIRGWI